MPKPTFQRRMAAMLAVPLLLVALTAPAEPPPAEPTTNDLTLHMAEGPAGAVLSVENARFMPYELIIERRSGEEVERTTRILSPASKTTLMEFEGWSRQRARDFLRENYRFVGWMGDPANIDHDDDYLYRLPFREGRRYLLSQGFNGKQSHQSEASRYAVDFQLEVGERVHAAREGVVAKVVDWFDKAGGPDFRDRANLIIILHDDGTMAHYVHLDHEGSLVREGERVVRGQHIGTSGMTGFTRGPHLHFVVRGARDRAIPIRFEGHADRDLSRRGRFRVPD